MSSNTGKNLMNAVKNGTSEHKVVELAREYVYVQAQKFTTSVRLRCLMHERTTLMFKRFLARSRVAEH